MCYNISNNKDPEYIENRFDTEIEVPEKYDKIYHVSAFNNPELPVISNEDPDKIQFYRWGLVPHWITDKERADEYRNMTGNARSEEIFKKKSYRGPIKSRRCIIPVDGFFEWREFGGKKYPYHIYLKDKEAFGLAGIWDSWEDSNGDIEKTFSVITTDANSFVERIHNTKKRMPVILEKDKEKRWLDDELEKKELESMMTSYDPEKMDAHTVKKFIASQEEDTNVPKAIQRHEYEELENQTTLF